jgi:alanyl-tRNA synthetase
MDFNLMTTRLYNNSPKLFDFKARIIASKKTSDGYSLCLDQTAFYPTSGGQPFDTGRINGIPVTDVWDDDKGKIWHQIPTFPDSDQIFGQIDWARRFDHMQQHSGQHILSAVFIDKLSANTIGFQIGKETSTIDIDISTLNTDAIHDVETAANTIVWANHPIIIQVISDENIGSIPFRKPPQVKGEIRVIWIKTIDASACGGTHVESTGEIGLIKIRGTERYKGSIRVTFTCGNRAFRDYQRIHHIVQNVSADLSIHSEDLPQAISRIRDDITKKTSALNQTQKELMTMVADQLWNETQERKGLKRIGVYLENRQYDEISIIANRLREYPNTIILLAAPDHEKIRLVCTRNKSLKEVDAGKIIKYAVSLLNGKGGGPPEMAHGGIPLNDRDVINEVIQKSLDSI